MGEMEWILLAAGPLFAVSGAIMLALQKRGKSNPFISAEEAGGHVVSGGGIMLFLEQSNCIGYQEWRQWCIWRYP